MRHLGAMVIAVGTRMGVYGQCFLCMSTGHCKHPLQLLIVALLESAVDGNNSTSIHYTLLKRFKGTPYYFSIYRNVKHSRV